MGETMSTQRICDDSRKNLAPVKLDIIIAHVHIASVLGRTDSS